MLTTCHTCSRSSCTISRRRCWHNMLVLQTRFGECQRGVPHVRLGWCPGRLCMTKCIRSHEVPDNFLGVSRTACQMCPGHSWGEILLWHNRKQMHCIVCGFGSLLFFSPDLTWLRLMTLLSACGDLGSAHAALRAVCFGCQLGSCEGQYHPHKNDYK